MGDNFHMASPKNASTKQECNMDLLISVIFTILLGNIALARGKIIHKQKIQLVCMI